MSAFGVIKGIVSGHTLTDTTTGKSKKILDIVEQTSSSGGSLVESVDGILPNPATKNIALTSPVDMKFGAEGNITVSPQIENIKDVSIYVSHDNGIVTINLSSWFNITNPRWNCRIVARTNNGGKLTFNTGSPNRMWRTDGTLGVPEIIDLTSTFQIFDIINTFGGEPALLKIYPNI